MAFIHTLAWIVIALSCAALAYRYGWERGFDEAHKVYIMTTKKQLEELHRPLVDTMLSIDNIEDVCELAKKQLEKQ